MNKLKPRYWPIILPSTQLLTLFCRKMDTVGNTGYKAKPLNLNVCRLYNFSFLILQSENVWDLPSNSQFNLNDNSSRMNQIRKAKLYIFSILPYSHSRISCLWYSDSISKHTVTSLLESGLLLIAWYFLGCNAIISLKYRCRFLLCFSWKNPLMFVFCKSPICPFFRFGKSKM